MLGPVPVSRLAEKLRETEQRRDARRVVERARGALAAVDVRGDDDATRLSARQRGDDVLGGRRHACAIRCATAAVAPDVREQPLALDVSQVGVGDVEVAVLEERERVTGRPPGRDRCRSPRTTAARPGRLDRGDDALVLGGVVEGEVLRHELTRRDRPVQQEYRALGAARLDLLDRRGRRRAAQWHVAGSEYGPDVRRRTAPPPPRAQPTPNSHSMQSNSVRAHLPAEARDLLGEVGGCGVVARTAHVPVRKPRQLAQMRVDGRCVHGDPSREECAPTGG